MRLFLDTNVLIDFLEKREPFYAHARKLMILAYVREVELWASTTQCSDLFYVLTDGGKPSRAEEAKTKLKRLRKLVHITFVDERGFDSVMSSRWADIEDAMVHQAALAVEADVIITRSQGDFELSVPQVFDCPGFFDYMQREHGISYEEIPF